MLKKGKIKHPNPQVFLNHEGGKKRKKKAVSPGAKLARKEKLDGPRNYSCVQ